MQAYYQSFVSRLRASVFVFSVLLEDRLEALRVLSERREITPGSVFRALHLPLLVTFPIGFALSPFAYWMGWAGMKYILFLTVFVLVGAFVLAVVTDRIAEADGPRLLEDPEHPHPRNLALDMHLPLSSIGLVYMFHPALGLGLLFAVELYCLYLSLDALSLARGVSRARALLYFVYAALFFLIPALVLAFLFAAYQTLVILMR